MRHWTIGIDPGLGGGIVRMDGRTIAEAFRMPTIGTGKRQYDDQAIKKWLQRIKAMAGWQIEVVAGYEISQPRTAGRMSASEKFGFAVGWLNDAKKAKGIHFNHRDQYLRDMCLEKINRLEKRCTGGRQGVLSAGRQGESMAMWRVHLMWAGIPAFPIWPATWQSAMIGGFPGENSKEKALCAAQAFWPDQDWLATPRSTVPHKGIIDAAIIAEFTRQRQFGGMAKAIRAAEEKEVL